MLRSGTGYVLGPRLMNIIYIIRRCAEARSWSETDRWKLDECLQLSEVGAPDQYGLGAYSGDPKRIQYRPDDRLCEGVSLRPDAGFSWASPGSVFRRLGRIRQGFYRGFE